MRKTYLFIWPMRTSFPSCRRPRWDTRFSRVTTFSKCFRFWEGSNTQSLKISMNGVQIKLKLTYSMLENTDFDINLRNMRPLVLLPNRKPHQSFLQLLHLLIVVQPLHFSFKIICTETQRERERDLGGNSIVSSAYTKAVGYERLACSSTPPQTNITAFVKAQILFLVVQLVTINCILIVDSSYCVPSTGSFINNDTIVLFVPHTHLTTLHTLFLIAWTSEGQKSQKTHTLILVMGMVS